MAAKKRRSGRGKAPRQGISGNPQRRAEQLAQRRPAIADEPDADFRSLRDLAYALAGGAKPSPWWAESHQRILAAARALTWPSRLVDLETQACRIVGDEFYERLNSRVVRAAPVPVAARAGRGDRGGVAGVGGRGTGDWPQLWALLCGLALTVPPGDTQSETAKLARETFPDIKDPYETVLAEAGQAAKLLADRGLAAGIEHPADGSRAAGDPLIACDAYGSRFLLVAPFGYDGEEVDHWYAWDIDSCWLLTVVGAGVFGSAQDALAEWQHAVGPAAGTALSPSAPEVTARLLAPCLADRADVGHAGGKRAPGTHPGVLPAPAARPRPRPLRRRRQRRRGLVRRRRPRAGARGVPGLVRGTARRCPAGRGRRGGHDPLRVGTRAHPEERSRYACSPHRIEMTARLIRDGYFPDHANAALRLLPEWTQWCIEQSGLTGDLAARSRAAALTEAMALVDEETNAPAAEQDEAPFRRQE